MNVSFTFCGGDEALEKKCSVEAAWVIFFTLAGHRSVDGCRASLYNGNGWLCSSTGAGVEETVVSPQFHLVGCR